MTSPQMEEHRPAKCDDCKQREATLTITQPKYKLRLCRRCATGSLVGTLERIYGIEGAKERLA